MRWLTGLFLALLCVAAPCQAGELRAGVAKVDMTPPVGTPLGGYANRKGGPSTGIHDPIYAKALVLDDGSTEIAIITTDLVGTSPEMARQVAELCDFPRERLLVSATHTHSGPGAYAHGLFAHIALGAFQKPVYDHLTQGMARVLKEARNNLQPAKLAIGEAQFPQFMRNRRRSKLKDPALWLLRVDTLDDKPLAALVNLTAHGTVLTEENMEFSGDWMAFTQAYLERELPGLVALYTNGAEGDISPNIPDNSSNFAGAKAHGELGGKAALELYRSLKPAREARLDVKTETLNLPQTLTATLAGASKETMLQSMTINDGLLVAVPGEMICQLGLLLKDHARRQGHQYPVIIGLANDHLGYFLTRAEMAKGGYESKVSFFGDTFGERLTIALARLIGGDLRPLREALNSDRPEPKARAGMQPETTEP